MKTNLERNGCRHRFAVAIFGRLTFPFLQSLNYRLFQTRSWRPKDNHICDPTVETDDPLHKYGALNFSCSCLLGIRWVRHIGAHG